MVESAKRGTTPRLPGGLNLLYLPIMKDTNEARKSWLYIRLSSLEGVVASPILDKDFEVRLLVLFIVLK